jgi:hypothetical protein
MGKPSQFPPGPITTQCAAGREQFRRIFKSFARQWSQPQLLKLTEAGLGDRVVHSSQISGFATGSLLDPAPKVLMALGKFNQLLATGALPQALDILWMGKEPMRTSGGDVMGPAEVFLVFTGEMDLQLGEIREIPVEKEAVVSRGLGKFVRTELAKAGVDFVVEDQQRLVNTATSFKGLLTGKEIRGEVLVAELALIAAEIGISEDDLWDEVMELINADA